MTRFLGKRGKAFVNRRFIVSKAALEDDGIDHMSMGRVLGNEDSKVVSYPVSSNVFKVAGGGANYVHGGSSPQEMLVPVLEFKMERGHMETKNAEIALVSIVHKITNLITSMDFIQSDAVSDTVKAANTAFSSSRKTMRKSRTKTVMWRTVVRKMRRSVSSGCGSHSRIRNTTRTSNITLWFMTKKAVWSNGGSLSSWTLPLQMTLDSDSDTEEAGIPYGMMDMAADDTREELRRKLRSNFDGRIVRKDLTKKIKEGANVPVYVLEFLLGQYCSSDDETIIEQGVQNVKRILADNFVRPDEAQKILSQLRKNGSHTIIDMVTVHLDIKKDCFLQSSLTLVSPMCRLRMIIRKI